MGEAVELSIQSIKDEGGPFGAVVVKDDKIIARGTNKVTKNFDPTAHAEIVAIREACKVLESFELKGCTFYTSSEPCPMCFGAIYWARLDAVYFANTKADAAAIGFDDSFIYKEILVSGEEQHIPFHHYEHEIALDAFSLWKKEEDKKEY